MAPSLGLSMARCPFRFLEAASAIGRKACQEAMRCDAMRGPLMCISPHAERLEAANKSKVEKSAKANPLGESDAAKESR